MFVRHLFWLLSVSVCLLVGCTSLSLYAQLPEEEQRLYRAYRHIMTPSQLRTYLALPTATERAAYASQVGASQVIAALSEEDRAAVLHGQPFEGMSGPALLLVWGEPYRREGPAFDERWWYLGDSFSLTEVGNSYHSMATVMEVALENGQVKWWQERIPSEERRSIIKRRFLTRPGD